MKVEQGEQMVWLVVQGVEVEEREREKRRVIRGGGWEKRMVEGKTVGGEEVGEGKGRGRETKEGRKEECVWKWKVCEEIRE